jgi:hypothetical protein
MSLTIVGRNNEGIKEKIDYYWITMALKTRLNYLNL